MSPPERFTMFGTEFRGNEIIRSPAGDDARHHIRRSYGIAGGAFLIFLLLVPIFDLSVAAALLVAVVAAYAAWSSYWGITGVFRMLTRVDGDVPPTFKAELFIQMTVESLGPLGIALAPFVVGVLYGAVGGGLREYALHRKVARAPGLILN